LLQITVGLSSFGEPCGDVITYRKTVTRLGAVEGRIAFPVFAMTYGAGNQFRMESLVGFRLMRLSGRTAATICSV